MSSPTVTVDPEFADPDLPTNRFHQHLEICAQCEKNPHKLCGEGDILIRETVAELGGTPVASLGGKRFFELDDNGCTWIFVATCLEGVKNMLAEYIKNGSVCLCYGMDKSEEPSWSEIAIEKAMVRMTVDEDSPHVRYPLALRPLGSFYCSEW